MILGNRSLYEISLEEIRALIEKRVPEGPHLEYKQNAYSNRHGDKHEMLRDVTALANAGGGYLILGIAEDGLNHTLSLCPIEGLQARTQAIRQVCLDGVQERIDNLEVKDYETGPDEGIIIVRVPRSEKVPHMIGFENRSDFYRRYGTDKRVMTIGEIRDSFAASPFFRRLADIQIKAQQASSRASSTPYLKILTERPVERFLERYFSGSGQQALLIVSPFIGSLDGETYELVHVVKKAEREGTRVYAITREPNEKYHKEGVAVLARSKNVEIRYNPDIHAKLYVAWNRVEEESFAMFGSGNLTTSGTSYNLELGMMILSRGNGRKLVRELYTWGNNLRTQSKKILHVGNP